MKCVPTNYDTFSVMSNKIKHILLECQIKVHHCIVFGKILWKMRINKSNFELNQCLINPNTHIATDVLKKVVVGGT